MNSALFTARRAHALRSPGCRQAKRSRGRARRRGFTLIEVLLVLAILVILAGLSVVAIANVQGNANNRAAKAQISSLQQAVDMYRLDVGTYPSDSVGLNALAAPPSDLRNVNKWKGPYVQDGKVPKDPWGNDYIFKNTGQRSYMIYSVGENQTDDQGGGDDISNLSEV